MKTKTSDSKTLSSLNKNTKGHPAPITPAGFTQFRQLRECYRAALDACPERDVLVINVDIPTAVATALGAEEAIRTLRARVETDCPIIDGARLDKISDYARLTGYLHAGCVAQEAAAATEGGVTAIADEVGAMRDTLRADAEPFAARRVFDPAIVAELRSGQGHHDLAMDVFAYTQLFRGNWEAIKAGTMVKLADLDRADEAAGKLLLAVGLKDRAPSSPSGFALDRARAFTLFVNAYNEARRVATFLRWWEKDADVLVPSLYARTGGSPRKSSDEAKKPEQAPQKPAGSVAGGAKPVSPVATRPLVAGEPTVKQDSPFSSPPGSEPDWK